MDQSNMRVGLWNVMIVLVIVVLGVPLLKIVTNKWLGRVPGLPTMVNAI